MAIIALIALPLATACGSDEPDDSGGATDAAVDQDAGDISDTAHDDVAQDAASDADEDNDAESDADATEDGGGDADVEEDPCGNGTVDDGETCDGDCPTACDDDNACTEGTLTGDPDQCTSACEYAPIAACDAYEGDYTGSYEILAQEKIGSSVINSVSCSGTFDASVDLAREDHLEGTAECTYSGGLTAFDGTQTATITGGIAPDGSVDARIVHDFGTDNDGTFNVDGTIAQDELTVDDTGSFYPNSQSAVAWDVEITLGGE
jgi:hypothetical protein